MKLLLTCEHGGNKIPKAYKNFFHTPVLKTHRGYDLGALDLFQFLKSLSDASFFSTTSRLLIELNRSLHHRNLFSEFSSEFSKKEKAELITTYYVPYRAAVEKNIKNEIENGESVLHLSIHSFTPKLHGEKRNCDIGLLYDSKKKKEQEFCKQFKEGLLQQDSSLQVRFNYPYLGSADGFTTYLGKQFPKNYIGVEIEVNQKFASENVLNLELKKCIFTAIENFKSMNYSF
ncbi:N-formylglutamate amidohydrolase [Ulvibacter litoralis]|uniref:Predicted N-formylglutamate amidohydrolase n=1 Tax=Ulvibacter litoralis TaxID=227084 RepID=A0A1G7FHG5_9FLAO|nr:N-formylglutamate amidohydrolase [Ulvibacter litoralis]GHC51120.1 hypothetical protein GCM10008083_13420 [Ulvibacter litoralis]SDE75328.1 Predicted N-formylglutamate amidohydrolase [Ulvibacter litoralis]